MAASEIKIVEIEVQMNCTCKGCWRKVKKSVKGMKGVLEVQVEGDKSKITVTGRVDPNHVLARLRTRTGKQAQLLPSPASPNHDSAHSSPSSFYDWAHSSPSSSHDWAHSRPSTSYSPVQTDYTSNFTHDSRSSTSYGSVQTDYTTNFSNLSISQSLGQQSDYTTIFNDEKPNSCIIM